MTKQRPTPPTVAQGFVPSVAVSAEWYEYLNADRNWALAEIDRLRNDIQELTCGDPKLVSSRVEPRAPLAVTRYWNNVVADCPKPGEPCKHCGNLWLPDPSGGNGVWHNCHT